MAEELKFGLELEDGMSGPAAKAAASVDRLEHRLESVDKGLHEAAEGFLKVKEPAEIMRHAVEGAEAGFREFGAALAAGEAKGAVTGLTEALAGVASTLDLVLPGMGQVASAAIKLGGAFAAVSVGIIQAAVESGLEVTEVNEKLEATFEALGAQGEGSGKGTLRFLDDLSAKLPQSRDELAKWTKQFEAMGVTDLGELRHQLTATASAQAILGDKGVAAFEEITERVNLAVEAHHGLKLAERSLKSLYDAGVNENDVAKAMGLTTQQLSAQLKSGTVDAQSFGNALSNTLIEKGKGPLEAMGNEMGTLYEKAKETWHHFFDGLDTTPITDSLKVLIGLGDQGTDSGKVLGDGIKQGTQTAIDAIGELITEGTVLFLNLETEWVKSGLSVHGIEDAFEEVEKDVSTVVEMSKELVHVLEEAAHVLGVVNDAIENTPQFGGAPNSGNDPLARTFGASEPARAPANADGGVVQPGRGEMFASVAPGEMILPAPVVAMMSVPASPANDNAGGVHIEHLELHITAPSGVTNAHEVSAAGLSVALERLQLSSGR